MTFLLHSLCYYLPRQISCIYDKNRDAFDGVNPVKYGIVPCRIQTSPLT